MQFKDVLSDRGRMISLSLIRVPEGGRNAATLHSIVLNVQPKKLYFWFLEKA